ncbi:uncharacterized protein [Miscanthus floridulus]|uniref:uncharacterized protein n=1 Tax=Miscanthus floridulus TaxID=154761 RepID=UPI00345814CD
MSEDVNLDVNLDGLSELFASLQVIIHFTLATFPMVMAILTIVDWLGRTKTGFITFHTISNTATPVGITHFTRSRDNSGLCMSCPFAVPKLLLNICVTTNCHKRTGQIYASFGQL